MLSFPPVVAFLDIGSQEMLLILIVALLLFGGRLPDVARNVGRTVGQLRRTAQNLTQDLRREVYEQPDPGSLSPRAVRPGRPPQSVPQAGGGEKPAPPPEPAEAAPASPGLLTSEEYVAREVLSDEHDGEIPPDPPPDPPGQTGTGDEPKVG